MRVLVVLAALAAAAPASAESYRELVEAYVRGDRAAIARVAQWPRGDLRGELKWLRQMRACVRCGERELADRFPFLGAALLHTARGFEDAETAPPGSADTFHLDFARELIEAAPDHVRRFEASWLLVVGQHFLRELEPSAAQPWFEVGAALFRDDARFHVGLGAAHEIDARLTAPPDYVRSTGVPPARAAAEEADRRRRLLREAETEFGRAAAKDPASADARIRHGRVLVALGRLDDGKRELDWVLERVSTGDARSLASLFRGQAAERAKAWPEAIAHYREAVRSGPPGARAAAIALAHALDQSGETPAAREEIDRAVARPGRDDPFDLYLFAPDGELERLLDEIKAAALRPEGP